MTGRSVLALIGCLMAVTGCVAGPTPVDRAAVEDLKASSAATPAGGALSGGVVTDAQWAQTVLGVRGSVLRVRNRTCDGLATGSGFVLRSRTLVTNAHVVEGARVLTVDTSDGVAHTVTVADVTTGEDLALVHTAEDLPPAVTMATADPVPGDLVQALGYPLGEKFTSTGGRVIDYTDGTKYGHVGRILQSSVSIHPGNSGGPLIDRTGKVVGVVFAIDLRNGSALIIPASRVSDVLQTGPKRAVDTHC